MERVLPAIHPEGVAAFLHSPDVASGHVRRALLDPESQLLPRARWPSGAPGANVWAVKEVWGNPGGAPLENGLDGAQRG